MIRIFKIMYFILLCGLYFHYELYPFNIAVSNNNIIYNYIGNCDNKDTENNFNIDSTGCVYTEYKFLDFFNFIKSFPKLFQTDDEVKLSSILNKDKNFKMLSYCGVDKNDEIVEKYFNVEIKSLEDVLVVSSSSVVKLIFCIDIYLPECGNLLKFKRSLKYKYPHNIKYSSKTKHCKSEDELLIEYKYLQKTKHYKSEDELLIEYKYLQKTKHYKSEDELLPEYKYSLKTKHYKSKDELLPEYKYLPKTKHYKPEDELLLEYKCLLEDKYKEFLKKIDEFV